jgi:XTP/dITP diphosphohydrolase
MARVVLVASSPRLPLLFPPQTWRALDAARPVLVLDRDHPSLPALDVAEVPWEVLAPAADTGPAGRDLLLVGQGLDVEAVALARRQADALLDLARRDGSATLLLPPVNDGPLVQLVADRAARSHVEVEAVYPVGEPKGSALLDLVATETRLRGPGGCPWDHEQTHASLARHLVEEAYEVLDAIEEGTPEHLREELGDLLLQVVFHAQMAEDAGDFDIDGVARAITEKLVRRHPHVFGELRVASAGEVVRNWETIKRDEEGRTDPMAGIPAALPALQLAAKLQKRAAADGFAWPSVQGPVAKVREELDEVVDATEPEHLEWEVGDLLFAVVALAGANGVEPEAALRRAARRFRARFVAARAAAEADGHDPATLDLETWRRYWKAAKRALAGTPEADPPG